jgi:broad specificity phosphatase PhoE
LTPSPPIERVWLVRHGQVPENVHRARFRLTAAEYNRAVEDSDHSPLTPEGEQQIEALVETFRGRPLPVVHSSPLKRARQTASIIAEPLGLEVVTIDGFTELLPAKSRTRLFTGRQRSVRYWFLRSMFRQFLPFSRVSESVWVARRRVHRAWEELLAWRPEGEADGSVDEAAERLVCTHRGTVMMLRSVLKRDRRWQIVRSSIGNGGITEIVRH